MKKIVFPMIIALIAIFACTSEKKSIVESWNEPEDNKPYDTIEWEAVPEGLQVSVATVDRRYSKKSVPDTGNNNTWAGSAWRGEKVNLQLVLWSAESVAEISCTASDLTDTNGNIISLSNVEIFFVRYLLTDEYGQYGCEKQRNPAGYDSLLVADILDPLPEFNKDPNSARPVWVTIEVPEDCPAGQYSGIITVNAKNQKEKKVELNLNVQNEVLPHSQDWDFHLDLWQNPYAVARYNNVRVWSEEHFNLLRPLLEMLADAGQKCITTSIVPKPWGGQTYDYFESMIKWEKVENEEWEFDYADFDKWVEFAMSCGIDEQINCYSMIPWGNNFTYFDVALQKDTTINTAPGSAVYEELWSPFLRQFTAHLKDKGWLDIAVIAMDERAPEDMQKAINFVKKVAPELKITLAGGYHEEINDDLYNLCVASKHIVPEGDLKQRSSKGFKTTFYVCCAEPYPNNFTFSPPAESAYMGWYAAAKGFDGFLRWAYNSWVKDPLVDSRFRRWPGGDTFLVYPGARSSIRFERLREGIQDFEKIKIVKSRLEKENTEAAKEKLKWLNGFLETVNISALDSVPAENFVIKGKKVLESLSKD
ncbi:MAG: glycoside hydrolase domain-containing protein [Draconibacterium sp.]